MIPFPLSVNKDIQLQLLKPQDIDTHYILLEHNRAHIGQWEEWAHTTTRDNQYKFLQTCQNRFDNHKGFACGIWYQSAYAGIITALLEENRTIELSYWLAKKHTGQGIMTQSVKALIQHLATVEGITKVRLIIAEHNIPSRNLAERLNFNLHFIMSNQRAVYLLTL